MTMPCMHIEMKLQHTGGFKLVLYLAFMVSECKAPWGLRLGCEFVHLTDCETTG